MTRSRLILPRQREGRAERILDDLCGPGAAQMVKDASKGHHAHVPVLGGRCLARNGELFAGIAGGSPFANWNEFVANQSIAAKKQEHQISQTGTANVVGRGSTLWTVGAKPPAGVAPTGLAGVALDRTSVGALGQANPVTGTLHISATPFYNATAAPHCLVMIDRLMHWRPTTTAGAQVLTGDPTRYQTTATAAGSIMFVEVATVLAATAHTPVVLYTDDAGNVSQTSPSTVGVSAAAVNTFDHANWFLPLATGDYGVRSLDSYNIGTTVATGALNLVVAHPMLYKPITVANYPHSLDHLNTIASLPEVLSNACLSHIVIPGVTTATTFSAADQFVESN